MIGAAAVLTVVAMLTGCAGPLAGAGAGADSCSRGVPAVDPDATVDLRRALASMGEIRDRVAEVPGVAGWWGDETTGRMVFEVASGDDGGAAACSALASLLDDAGVPYAFQVFKGPVESTQRTTVGFDEAWTDDGVGLQVNAWSCNGEPAITVLEESTDEVRVQITATIPAPGWGGDDCLDTVSVPLEQPIDARTLIDLTSGKTVPVELRQHS